MTIDNLKIPTVALGTWAWGDSGELGDGYFGSHLTPDGLEAIVDTAVFRLAKMTPISGISASKNDPLSLRL